MFHVAVRILLNTCACVDARACLITPHTLLTVHSQEFITREYLHGSTGNVGPPILSRLYQFTSDGMVGYNQARKVAYIPFPFPHAQITSLFVTVVVFFMPILMISFVSNETFAFVMNLLTVMCFSGLHEVARELENPFVNVPNEFPVNNYQAQFNEALMTMFQGYHPDSYWEVGAKEEEEETSTYLPGVSEDPRENDPASPAPPSGKKPQTDALMSLFAPPETPQSSPPKPALHRRTSSGAAVFSSLFVPPETLKATPKGNTDYVTTGNAKTTELAPQTLPGVSEDPQENDPVSPAPVPVRTPQTDALMSLFAPPDTPQTSTPKPTSHKRTSSGTAVFSSLFVPPETLKATPQSASVSDNAVDAKRGERAPQNLPGVSENPRESDAVSTAPAPSNKPQTETLMSLFAPPEPP